MSRWKYAGILMACGHSANAEDGNGNPVCAICIGLDEGATKVVNDSPSLEGRIARCGCGNEEPSSFELPYFEYCGERRYDSYYCGHGGWD